MTTTFSIFDVLQGSIQQKAALLTSILKDVDTLLKREDELSETIPYQLTKKGQKERNRYNKLLSYKGPDDETIRLLEREAASWLRNPSSFWDRPHRPCLNYMDPQAQIVGCFLYAQIDDTWSRLVSRCACILLVEYQTKHGRLSDQEIACLLCVSGIFGTDMERFKRTISSMIDAGSRYRNLEKHLGMGAALVLGTDIAETTWARVLPKKDEKFDQVITHLRTTPLAELSLKYAQVRVAVVNNQLNAFGITIFTPSMQASSPHTTMDVSCVMDEDLYLNNYASPGVLFDDPMYGMVNGWDPLIDWES